MASSRSVAIAACVAVALGAFSWWVDQLSWWGIPEASPEYVAFGILQVLGNGPTLWVLAAAGIGATTGRLGRGAVFATGGLAGAVCVYYALIVVFASRPDADLGRAAVAWLLVAAVTGPVMGMAGAAITQPGGRRRWVGAGVVGAALVGIGIFFVPSLAAVGLAHIAAGVALAAAVTADSRRWSAAAVAVALGTVAAVMTQLAFDLVWELLRRPVS